MRTLFALALLTIPALGLVQDRRGSRSARPVARPAGGDASAVEAWAFAADLFAASAARCEAQVTGIHVPGLRTLTGPPPVEPERLPPLPTGATALEVRRLDVNWVEAGRFQVSFQLALRGGDPLAGALMLEDVLARWAAQPELEGAPQHPTTWPLPDEQGVMTTRMTLGLDLGARPRPARGDGGAFHSLEHAIRALALEGEPLRAVRFAPGGWQDGSRGPHRAIELRALNEVGAPAARLHRFLSAVESSAPGLTLRSLTLSAPGETGMEEAALPDAWAWSARLAEFREPAAQAPSSRPSSLESLHLVLGVLGAFEREGVELGGFVPTRTYAGLTRRELGLGDATVRDLSTNRGYLLELRQLDAAMSRDGGSLQVSLGLRFTHPQGTVEATRLYEAFRAALQAQPEVRTVELVTAKADGADSVEVQGLDVVLARGGIERPQAPAQRSGPMTYLRSIAAREGIDLGELNLNVRDRPEGVEVELNLAKAAPRAQSVYDLLWSVETDEAGYRVHQLRLRPDQRTGGWTMSATTLVDHGR